MDMLVYGWFSDKSDTPEHDPGVDSGICAVCKRPLTRPIVTTSFYAPGDYRSFFYRMHKSCKNTATPDMITDIESVVIDGVVHKEKGL